MRNDSLTNVSTYIWCKLRSIQETGSNGTHLNFALFLHDFAFLIHTFLKTISEPLLNTSEWAIHVSLPNSLHI